jgi:hypothetical protein
MFSPSDLGFPATRNRKYIIAIRRSKWVLPEGFDHGTVFRNTFGRSLACSGSAYLNSTQRAEVKVYSKTLGERVHMAHFDAEGKLLPMYDLLPLSHRRRIDENAAEMKAKGLSLDDDWFVYICQNSGWGNRSLTVPAILRRSKIWSFSKQRVVLPQEHLKIMGIDLAASLTTEASEGDLKSLAGNAMHAAAIASVVLFAFACAERRA